MINRLFLCCFFIFLAQSLELTLVVSEETRIGRNQTREVKINGVRIAWVFSLEQTENRLVGATFIIEIDQAAQMSLVRRPIARCIVTLFERDQYFFFDRSKSGSLAEIMQDRQRAAPFAHCDLRLFLEELKQRRQLVAGCAVSRHAAHAFSDGAVQRRQQLLRFPNVGGIGTTSLRCETPT